MITLSDRAEFRIQSLMIFLIETDTLEEAYCFGLDMLEHLTEQPGNPTVTFYLFVKDIESAKGYHGFTFKHGQISAEFMYEIFPHDTSLTIISGSEDFKSRMYASLREVPNKNPEMVTLEYN